MQTKYTFNFSSFLNNKVDTTKLAQEIGNSTVITALDYINTYQDECDIWFKDELSSIDSTTLNEIVSLHDGEPIEETPLVDPTPRMADGRPIVRADTRPLNSCTYFTMCGDDATSIGGGVEMVWDFSNDDDLYTGPDVPPGFKCKSIMLTFHCPVYIKDGTLYFFDAPWGAYTTMDIVVPPNNYYPNPAGNIPAVALGLPNDGRMYSFSGSEYVSYVVYVQKHRMYTTCAMGDELNAEGAAVNPVPPGWIIRGRIYTPVSDTISKGYASFEMYRNFTTLRPGMTVENLQSYIVDPDV